MQPIVVDCDYTCPPNTRGEIEQIPGQCCGNLTCVPIEACELSGVMYSPGESMPSDDPCMVAWWVNLYAFTCHDMPQSCDYVSLYVSQLYAL